MINPKHKLSIRRQVESLEISHPTVYYRPHPVADADLRLMRRTGPSKHTLFHAEAL